jgi:hypothetical protein
MGHASAPVEQRQMEYTELNYFLGDINNYLLSGRIRLFGPQGHFIPKNIRGEMAGSWVTIQPQMKGLRTKVPYLPNLSR